ncbi:heterokaryon incompatibility protein-domain-containing protein, partial [Massariosphaeria phaeospora]
MRLIHAESLQLCEFFEDAIPRYAILSHTWHNDEVTFQDMISGKAESKAGYAKITSSCRQALYDKVKYVWVDTCCIDKTSSAELSEAINSMYRWYENSNRCYAFMADVEIDDRKPRATWRDDFSKSRWFTRGWTLQELLAPDDLHFFSKDWLFMGDKMSLYDVISEITNIDIAFLQGKHLTAASIAERMAWASMRNTTRIEDSAYSLLGIFDVSMPLLYGEGEKAFTRLQEEILKSSEDQTIFAWG